VLPGVQGHGRGRIRGAPGALALFGEEEERPVASVVEMRNYDRSAKRPAELVLLERAERGAVAVVAPRVRFQFAVPQEVVARSVQLVRAGLGRDGNDAAACAAELRR